MTNETGMVTPCQGHARHQETEVLMRLRGCNSQHGGIRDYDTPCSYRMRTTDPGCTGCTGCCERVEDVV